LHQLISLKFANYRFNHVQMKKIFGIVVLGIALIVVSGCRGSQQNKLIGAWKQVPYTKPDGSEIIWEFYAGDAVVVSNFDTAGVFIDSVSYTYSIDRSTFNVFGDGDYYQAQRDPRGEYWVDELGDSNFKITKRKHPDGSTDGVYLRLEFIKQ